MPSSCLQIQELFLHLDGGCMDRLVFLSGHFYLINQICELLNQTNTLEYLRKDICSVSGILCLSIGSVIWLVQQDGELIIKKLPPSFEYGKYSCLVSSVKLTIDTSHILPPSQYIRRNHLWFKDQGTYLMLSINTSISASMYVSLESVPYIMGLD